MEFLVSVFVVLHLLGMAAIIGSAVFVARGAVTPALVWGARAQLVTGILLVGLVQMNDEEVNNAKIGIKLFVAIAVVVFAEIAGRQGAQGPGRPPEPRQRRRCAGPGQRPRRRPLELSSVRPQGMRISLPWVRRPSRSAKAVAASASG